MELCFSISVDSTDIETKITTERLFRTFEIYIEDYSGLVMKISFVTKDTVAYTLAFVIFISFIVR